MTKAAVVVLADDERHANLGRLVNALETAGEFAERDADGVDLISDGAGTRWIPHLEDEESDQHELYRSVWEYTSVWDFPSGASGVGDTVDDAGATRPADHDGHPSIRAPRGRLRGHHLLSLRGPPGPSRRR